MPQISQELLEARVKAAPSTMKALVFHGPNQIWLETVPIPKPQAGEAVIRVTLTTICGTDLHILKGKYPVKPGLIIGHEAVGVIHELGAGVTGYDIGDRVLVGAITPCGQCNPCLSGNWSQCGGPAGGWKFGNTIDGAQAVLAGATRSGELGENSRGVERRRRRLAGRCRIHGHLGGGER